MVSLKEKISAEALRLGFSFVGFSKADQTPHFAQFISWLESGNNHGLDYLGKKYVIDARRQPQTLLKDARSVISLGLAYKGNSCQENSDIQKSRDDGILAAYACLPDYHALFKEKAKRLIQFMNSITKKSISTRFFVDSGPVLEKDFAFQSGLGWIGKNSLLITPAFGSYCLIGCLFTDLYLEPDFPDETDRCGACDLCIKACPTGAIESGHSIKTKRCISYLTTCHKETIEAELCKLMGNHVFGCDICQMVCPKNQSLNIFQGATNNYIKPIISCKLKLGEELILSDIEYQTKYAQTPIRKLSHELFLRNVIIAIGNSEIRKDLLPLIEPFKTHPSPVVRVTAAWALLEPNINQS